MNRFILVQGIVRTFVPLVGTLTAVTAVTAVTAGLAVCELFGYSVYHTFFFIIVPIIGGGIGEGILPLSLAYSSILGGTPTSTSRNWCWRRWWATSSPSSAPACSPGSRSSAAS